MYIYVKVNTNNGIIEDLAYHIQSVEDIQKLIKYLRKNDVFEVTWIKEKGHSFLLDFDGIINIDKAWKKFHIL